jgi:hypothetical protein
MIMKNSPHIVLTRFARETGVPEDELRAAAVAAAGPVSDIWFKAFRVRGRQFALSTRVIVEVDYFPHRTPVDILTIPKRLR